ncbi:helix-turn-helix transcriptional regulator [Sphingobacterium ginsenosidimutans]|uniref:HTH cro/C1-type domain-containing protein n=1 Tax=Sphingobacterium ginsenosidimutans TaxID=687845 RepID=A0ABP7ZW53_9SPHI
MIKNTTQENLTRERIQELSLLRRKTSENQELSDIEKQYSLNSFDGMISILQEELEEYEALKNSNFNILEAKSLDELPQLLIKARIVQHMSQTALAKRLGIQAQQIQRYEANDYQSISFDRLIEIAKILNVCVNFEKTVTIGSGPRFEIPTNINEDDIEKAEQIIKERGSLVL